MLLLLLKAKKPQSKGLKTESATAKETKTFPYSSQRKQTHFPSFAFLLFVLFFWPQTRLDLDALNGLSDVLQQRLVLRALVLVLVSVHVCQGADISVKVLFVHWLLREGESHREKEQSEGGEPLRSGTARRSGRQRGRKGTLARKEGTPPTPAQEHASPAEGWQRVHGCWIHVQEQRKKLEESK